MFVFVLNQHGKPLMPCKPQKARRLLTDKKAKVIKRTPFTIQLLYGSSGYKQPISLGVDTGTKRIGFSATTSTTVLLEGEVQLRTDVQKLLATRRAMRNSRRSRKTRYRQARFLNRKKPKGWLAPSIQHKVDAHLKLIQMLHRLLPICNLTLEIAQFDIQKIKNPDISGDLYQKGDQLGFWNVREYVFFRDKHTCQHCKGKTKDKILNVHHIESRKTGGNAPDNLIALCETCHHKIHQQKLEHLFQRKSRSLRDASQMTVMRWFIYNATKETYPSVRLTYGFITKNTRIGNGLDKRHTVDARCISGNPLAEPPKVSYFFRQVRANNRQLHKMTIGKKGKRKANKAERLVHGYQLFDKVQYEGQTCFVFARRKTGYFDLRTIQGFSIHKSASYKKLTLLERATTWLVDIQPEGDESRVLT